MHKFYFKAFVATAAGAVLIMLLGLGAGYMLKGSGGGSGGSDTVQEPRSVTDVSALENTESEVPQEKAVSSSGSGIAIPGFESATFKAGEVDQDLRLYNPEENGCVFVITLSLPDGSTFYQSDMLKPGQEIEKIHLQKEISAGSYPDCTLSYACYSLDDFQTLNGAQASFDLEVK